jgi:hypothetical protein
MSIRHTPKCAKIVVVLGSKMRESGGRKWILLIKIKCLYQRIVEIVSTTLRESHQLYRKGLDENQVKGNKLCIVKKEISWSSL